jgi:hypothetical protein
MTWRTAYFQQAQHDYGVFRELRRRTDVAMCHKLHYLQMATEKLAKAFLSPRSGRPPPRVHVALCNFLKMSKGRPEIRRLLGYENDYHAYCSYIDSLLSVAERIEKLAPVGGQERVNPEYPWLDHDGNVVCPASYSFCEFGRQEITSFQHLTDSLFRVFEDEYVSH